MREALHDFERGAGRPAAAVARAPGRVNLIGEHTDYCEGLVLPCAIDRDTWALAAPRDDGRVVAVARDLDRQATFEVSSPLLAGDWADYVRGVVAVLGESGHPLPGFDLLVTSRVPRESGLSSSAALCVAVTTVLDGLFDLGLDAIGRARVAHAAESDFVGVGCGILDPFASALGLEGHALRIDCRSGEAIPIPLPAERVALLVVDSGVSRKLASAEGPAPYQVRVAECASALEAVRAMDGLAEPKRALRDLSLADLPALAGRLDSVLLRRVRHVVSENARVDAVCEALQAGDLQAVGAAMRACQASLRDDYEVSIPELDALCEAGDAAPGVFGSRLTGAGFGGCTLHLVDPDRIDDASREIGARFRERFGRLPAMHRMRPAPGASLEAVSR